MIKNQKALNVPQVLLFHWAPSAISTFFENSVQFEKKKTGSVSFCPMPQWGKTRPAWGKKRPA